MQQIIIMFSKKYRIKLGNFSYIFNTIFIYFAMDPSKSTVRERVWLKSRNLQTAFPRGWMCPCACVHVKINKFVSLQKCSFNLLSDDEHDEDNDNTRQSTWPQGRDHLPPKVPTKNINTHSPMLKGPPPNKDTSRSLEKTRNSDFCQRKGTPANPEVAQRKRNSDGRWLLNLKSG